MAAPFVSAVGETTSDLDKLEPAVARLVQKTRVEVEAHPDRAAAHGKLGMVYEANNLWPEARASYERASDLDAESSAWRFRLAIAARETGDAGAALEILRRLEEMEGTDFPAMRQRLGELLLISGDLKGARWQYHELVSLAPQAPQGYVGVAETWLRERQFERAMELLETALALDPSYRVSHQLLGLAYRGLGRLEEAGTLLGAGCPAEAAALLETVVVDNPRNPSALNNQAIAYMRMGETDRAGDVLLRARELAPDRFSTYLNLSSLAMRSRRPDEALKWADVAVEKAPDQARTHATRAGVLAATARFAEAVGSAERATQIDPGDLRAQPLPADRIYVIRAWRADG